MKIKIGPVIYTIEKANPAQFKRMHNGESDYIGLANHKDSKIFVLEGMAPEFGDLILTHEIVHAIASVYGLDILQENESGIHTLAVAIVELMKNNPWWVKRIMSR